MREHCPQHIECDRLIHSVRTFHVVLCREQALKRPLIGLALLTCTALPFSSTLRRVEVRLLARLTEGAASPGAGNGRGFVHARPLSVGMVSAFDNQQSRGILPSSSDLNPR